MFAFCSTPPGSFFLWMMRIDGNLWLHKKAIGLGMRAGGLVPRRSQEAMPNKHTLKLRSSIRFQKQWNCQ
jgi:hypothetical protein